MVVATTRGPTQGKPSGHQRPRAQGKPAKPILHLTDARLDFRRSVPLKKSFIVASSYRCGSTFLCKELWQTGLLGAPWEYFNPRKGALTNSILDTMMKRLNASSMEDYVSKLLACRTSKNGVFGMKTHFHDFEATLKAYPGMLDALSPITYIVMERRDKLAQAVSMARAMQTNSWISLAKPDTAKLHYDRDLISQCMGKSEMQRLGWQRWFEANDINPFVVVYEEMTANPAGLVRSIVEYLDVQDDEPNNIRLPPIEKQSDDTNEEWVARFAREVETGVGSGDDTPNRKQPSPATAAEPLVPRGKAAAMAEQEDDEPDEAPDDDDTDNEAARHEVAEGDHFLDRYSRFARGEHPRPLRMRHRYDAIIGRNRELFRGARVLDIGSADGMWTMAALDAGAAHVVGIESKKKRADAAKTTLAQLGAKTAAFQFVTQQTFQALQQFGPDEFDVVLCTAFFEQSDPRYFFDHMRRLRPKHVILDTGIAPGMNPITRFTVRQRDDANPAAPLSASILSTPSHELIALFCDVYGFHWRTVEVQDMGITDWSGIRDYERDRRRTYVLELAT